MFAGIVSYFIYVKCSAPNLFEPVNFPVEMVDKDECEYNYNKKELKTFVLSFISSMVLRNFSLSIFPVREMQGGKFNLNLAFFLYLFCLFPFTEILSHGFVNLSFQK